MLWRFTLIDRFDNRTIVDEPFGWDAFVLKLKRHPERHGTYRELQGSDFKFHGAGAELLRAEHELYGIRGNYRLQIEGMCNGSWTTFYLGKLGFDAYKFYCDNGCMVSVKTEEIGAVVKFINRFNQKVDLGKTVCFDETTELAEYENLSRDILVPSKTIILRGEASMTSGQTINETFVYPFAHQDGSLGIPFQKVGVSSIKKFTPQMTLEFIEPGDYVPEIIYNDPEQSGVVPDPDFEISFRIKGIFKYLSTLSGNHSLTLSLKKGTGNFVGSPPDTITIQSWMIQTGSNVPTDSPFDISYSDTVNLQPGEYLWLNFFLVILSSAATPNYTQFVFDVETFFHSETRSTYPPTLAKFFLVNETISRVIEAITDNSLKLYSEWYGRKDSEPYDFPENGCGSLKGLSTGLLIRNVDMADGTEPKMFLSMQEIFESLSAVDNIGVGFEGEDKVRIENWKWFYQDTVVFRCRNIDKLEKSNNASEHWSKFITGYEKWEAEDQNGLDEFLTKREYRTALSEVQNELTQLCKFIASGYAIEITRRKQNDSKDWRFDNDTFLLCLATTKLAIGFINGSSEILITPNTDDYAPGDSIQLSNTVSNNSIFTVVSVTHPNNNTLITVVEATVNEGLVAVIIENLTAQTYDAEINNISTAQNILDPFTVFNFRISPARNAMRWFDRVAQCYRNITNADELIFSAGDGNFIAEGVLVGNEGCILEDGLLKENQNINLTAFDDEANGKPILHPERVKYSYPLSFSEYNQIKSQPYGLIYYQCGSERGHGWIDEIEYLPEEGIGKFTLIPKTNY